MHFNWKINESFLANSEIAKKGSKSRGEGGARLGASEHLASVGGLLVRRHPLDLPPSPPRPNPWTQKRRQALWVTLVLS